MRSNMTTRIASLALLSTIFVGATANAATDTDTLSVSVTVETACSVAGGTLDFGTYTGGQQAALDGQGTITFANCGVGTLTLELDGGQAGNVNARTLKANGGGELDYQLYRNASRNQIWGTGNDAQLVQLLIAGNGSVPVYGKIPGGQTAAAGTYTDTVNITLTF